MQLAAESTSITALWLSEDQGLPVLQCRACRPLSEMSEIPATGSLQGIKVAQWQSGLSLQAVCFAA